MLDKDALDEWLLDKELADRRTARLLAMIYNCTPGRQRRKTEKDFMPQKQGTTFATNKNKSGDELLAKAVFFHNLFTSVADHKEN